MFIDLNKLQGEEYFQAVKELSDKAKKANINLSYQIFEDTISYDKNKSTLQSFESLGIDNLESGILDIKDVYAAVNIVFKVGKKNVILYHWDEDGEESFDEDGLKQFFKILSPSNNLAKGI